MSVFALRQQSDVLRVPAPFLCSRGAVCFFCYTPVWATCKGNYSDGLHSGYRALSPGLKAPRAWNAKNKGWRVERERM
ncbi:hypothetical protein BaRGS_00015909, partial [Batillaria attramentaria]